MRTPLGNKREATVTLRSIADQHPELADDLLPIAAMLELDADLISMSHAVAEHGSIWNAVRAGDERIKTSGLRPSDV